MKRSRIPPIGGLISFVAAARHESFTSAARELNLSQAAVSRHIRDLEAQLGVRLFERVRQRVVLTEAGKLYLSHVKRPLDDLAVASCKVTAFSGGMTLNLAVLPTLAARWLMPRLPRFQSENPNVIIHLTTPQSAVEFSLEPFDIAIFHCSPDWPRTTAHHLMNMDVVAVCSPKLNANRAIQTPADIAKFPLLHLMARPNRWAEWMTDAGVSWDASVPGHSYQNSAMVAQAAVAGLGVALMPRGLFEEELEDNRLEIVGGHFRRAEISYYLIMPEARAGSATVQAFAAWLMKEAREWSRSEGGRLDEKKRRHEDPRDEKVRTLDFAYRGGHAG